MKQVTVHLNLSKNYDNAIDKVVYTWSQFHPVPDELDEIHSVDSSAGPAFHKSRLFN